MLRRLALRRLALLTVFAPLAACPMPDDDTGTMTCIPEGDAVPAGVYGGAHYQLTVSDTGEAELLGDCSRATVDAVPITEGVVHWVLTWQSGYGLPVQDTASIEYIDVSLDGSYCGGELTGTLTFPDGSSSDIDVVLGAQAEIYACE
jgi:hypothetical protein